mmetsp:Transcript_7773/g.21681  ORF Transcript_7773/g.21681 Transcript_7773/m.21681 type:complete len:465 (+) Transcript_7773:78-1472(+)
MMADQHSSSSSSAAAAAATDSKVPQQASHSSSSSPNDFVIRDGFPALRLPRNGGDDNDTSKTMSAAVNSVIPTTTTTPPWIQGEEPLPRHDFWGHEHCFEFQNVEKLWDDCRAVFSARTRDDDAAYSQGITYYLPSQMKPRCALEAMVQTIFQQHTLSLEEGCMIPEQSGAEWWTLVLDEAEDEAQPTVKQQPSSEPNGNNEEEEEVEGDEVGLHFDADYGLEDQAPNLLLHPRVATVTYLTATGAPTIVLDRRSPPPSDVEKKSLQGPVSKAWLSHPKLGKHIAFDGRLLHGAPATFFPSATPKRTEDEPPSKRAKQQPACSQRITLLVNVWVNHCPMDAEPLDDEICQQLTPFEEDKKEDDTAAAKTKETTTKKSIFEWTKADLGVATKMTKVPLHSSQDDPAGEEEVVVCSRLVSIKYNPTMEALHKASNDAACAGGFALLDLQKSSIIIEVGEEVQEDEE